MIPTRCAVLGLWIAALAWSQLPSTPLHFEVASIAPVSVSFNQPPRLTQNGYDAEGVTLRTLVTTAYQVRPPQISGTPAWADTQLFAVNAKAAGAVTPAQIREMLQSLLADRFQLKVSRETREVPALALIVTKKSRDGYLTAVDGSDCKPEGSPDNPCGKLSAGPAGIVGKKISIALMSQMLTAMLQRPVLDRTGLTGVYDVKVELVSDPALADESPAEKMQGGIASLLAGLENQLGFKTEPTRTQEPVIVIERVNRPSEN